MAALTTLQSFWSIITEFDLRPLAAEALEPLMLAIIAAPGTSSRLLADQMRRDPARPDVEVDTPLLILDLETAALLEPRMAQLDLVILLLDGLQSSFNKEKELAHQLADSGKRVLVFVELPQKPASPSALLPVLPWKPRFAIYGPVNDAAFLIEKLIPAVIRLLPDKILALGRSFPLFRVPIARYLISDTSQSNAAYSVATGVGELVPIVNIPLVVTDMIILTKNQAFLAYKLGLVFGYTTDWQSYVGEFGGVLGFGFVLRQLARTLVGLIPGFGIIPKVSVAYAGTVVVGNTILQWYLTGRHVSAKQLKGAYQQAYLKGKGVAQKMLPRLPRRKPKQLPPAEQAAGLSPAGQSAAVLTPIKPKILRRRAKHTCPQCKKVSGPDASFCQYCGYAFTQLPPANLPPSG